MRFGTHQAKSGRNLCSFLQLSVGPRNSPRVPSDGDANEKRSSDDTHEPCVSRYSKRIHPVIRRLFAGLLIPPVSPTFAACAYVPEAAPLPLTYPKRPAVDERRDHKTKKRRTKFGGVEEKKDVLDWRPNEHIRHLNSEQDFEGAVFAAEVTNGNKRVIGDSPYGI